MNEESAKELQPIDPIKIASELLAKAHQPNEDRIEALISEAALILIEGLPDNSHTKQRMNECNLMALAEIALSLRCMALIQMGQFFIMTNRPVIAVAKKGGPKLGLN